MRNSIKTLAAWLVIGIILLFIIPAILNGTNKELTYSELLSKIEAGENISIFNAKVENTLDKDLDGYLVYIIFLDENGNEIDKVETSFPKIEKGKTGYITATSTKDIATAYDIKIERKQ